MSDPKSKPNNEIDLLDLFSSIWKGIGNFFMLIINVFLFLFVFGIKRIHWMLLIAFVGIGLGYLIYLKTPRYYSSEMIAQPNGFTSIDMAQYINDIHEMCLKKNAEGIVEAFQISETSAKLLKDIEAFYFIDVNKDGIGDYVDYKRKFNPIDTSTNIVKSRILIRAEILSNDKFDEVKQGLTKYIDRNPYLLAVNDLRKRELKALIEQSESELKKLDSLQNYEYYKGLDDGQINRESQIVFLNEKLTQLYYRDKESLLNKRLRYQQSLELATEPITIIKDFTSLQFEENPKMGYLIKYGVLTSIIGYILLLYIAYRRIINEYLSSKA